MPIFSTTKCLTKNHLNVFIFYEFRGKEGSVCEVYLDYREKKIGCVFFFFKEQIGVTSWTYFGSNNYSTLM